MKKRLQAITISVFLVFGTILLVSCGSSGGGSNEEASDCIFCDDFESGSLSSSWINPAPVSDPGTPYDNTPVSVDNSMGANGTTSSMWLDNRTEAGDYDNGSIALEFPDGVRPTYVSFYARYKEDVNSTGADYALAVIFHDRLDTENSEDLIYFEFDTDDDHDFSTNGDADTIGMALPNTWYHIEFKNIDGESNSYDFYVDGVLIESDIELINGGVPEETSLKKITIGSDVDGTGDAQQAWIDEIVIQ